MLSILLLTANTWASDLLVPAFSPKPGSESAGAEMMYSAAIDAIRDRRIEFLDDNDIRTFAGSAGDDCALRKECPGNLWGTLEGRLAMIGTVGMNGDMLSVVVEFHRPGVDGPVEFLQDDLPKKDVYNLAVDLALIADDLLHLKDEDLGGGAAGVAAAGALGGAAATAAILGSLEDPAEGGDGLAVASDPVLGDAPAEGSEEEPEGAVAAAPLAPEPEPAPAAEPEPEPEPEPETAVAPAHRERTQRAASGEEKAEQRRMGLPLYAYNKYRASGKDPAQWMADEQVRTRRFFIELHAGVSFGDVKRRYATRVAV